MKREDVRGKVAARSASISIFGIPGFIQLVCVICSLHPLCARAGVTVTFPLEGHYRAGRYVPVHVVANGVTSDGIEVKSDGSLPLILPARSGAVDVTAPWLAISQLGNAAWSDAGEHPMAMKFEPLADNQILVALAGIDAVDARGIFPKSDVVTVQLDAANPLPGPPAAWEALDGLLLDENAAARVDDNQLRTLLVAGTTVAIRSERRPGGSWPWQRAGAYWIVAHPRVGPEALIEPAAYGPTYSWARGQPLAVRMRALLAGIIVAALLIGAALLRSRRGLVGVAVGAIVTSVLWISWQGRQAPLNMLTARVVVNTPSQTQQDEWTWLASPVATDTAFVAKGLTHPIFFTHSQLAQTQMRLVCAGNDQPIEFRFHLEPRLALAFVSGTLAAGPDRHPLAAARSTFATMAQDVYTNSRVKLTGEYTDGDGSQTVVGERNDSAK